MTLQAVKSSNVRALGYHDGALVVMFKSGSTYRYEDVPETVYRGIRDAQSIGVTLQHVVVRNPTRFPGRRLTVEESAGIEVQA